MAQNQLASTSEENASGTAQLHVLEKQVYRGPNIYGYEPMIRFQLDLGALEHHPSNTLPDFNARLTALLPTLHEHGCSYGEPGGFIRRLHEGTWLGHVTEHVALELQTLAGTSVSYGKTRSVKGREGVYNVMYTYREERVGLLAGLIALRLVSSLLPPHLQGIHALERLMPDSVDPPLDLRVPFELERELEVLRRLARRFALGPTTASLVDEARRRGIPVMRLDDDSLVQLGYGKYARRLRASITSHTSYLAVEAAGDKSLTNRLLLDAGLPAPRGTVVRNAEDAVREAKRLGYPVVTKPLDGNHGRGVCLDLNTPEQVRWGFEQAREHSPDVMVERYYQGRDYRVLVVNGRVIAAAERVPAHVIGDGQRSIAQLIEEVNADPRRGEGHEQVLTRHRVDEQVLELLARSNLTPQSVPQAGEVVFLRATGNISTGGTAVDRTDEMHPHNVSVAQRAARILGLDVAGLDFVMPDITRSIHETGGAIVEVNACPGFRMHLQPSEGTPRNVAAPVIDSLFPGGSPSRIPVIAITGTNGKSTTTRMVAHIMQQTGTKVGFTTSSGIYIDGELIMDGDTTGPKSARVVLSDPLVDVAVLETARGGLLREGLAFERCDVGAVLNIQPDHLGLKGIETLEDLAHVKSLVVEVVDDAGYSVLNADDPLTTAMRDRAGGKIAFFSMQGSNAPEHLARHIAAGGLALVCEPTLVGDELVVYDGGQRLPLIRARDIPATLGGLARVNVQNALAAAAIAFAAGAPLPLIRAGLASFTASYEQSPGRLNLYDGHPFRVLLDYAHNPSGLEHLMDLIANIRPTGGRVIGVVGAAGDRRDQDIRQMGELAGRTFDELIIREDDDRRGRPVGQSAQLLIEGARSVNFQGGNLRVILDEREAVDAALRAAHQGDLVVVLGTEVEDVWQQIRQFDATSTPPRVTPELHVVRDVQDGLRS